MPISVENVERQTRNLRLFLSLNVAWSVLQCAFVIIVYKLHLADTTAYLLAIIPMLPPCAIIALAARNRASEKNPKLRQYLFGAILYAAVLLFLTLLLVSFALLFIKSAAVAALTATLPVLDGIIPALMLLLPRRMLEGGTLTNLLLPVRIKLALPAVRRSFRLGALYIVYFILSFANSLFFDHHAPAGVLAYAVALLPVLPIFGLIPIYNKYIAEEQDEFQRHLFHQSILWALLGTFLIASTLGRLQAAHLIFHRHPDYFLPYSVFPLFYWLQLEAVFVVRTIQERRNR